MTIAVNKTPNQLHSIRGRKCDSHMGQYVLQHRYVVERHPIY